MLWRGLFALGVFVVGSGCREQPETPTERVRSEIERNVALWLPELVPVGRERELFINEIADLYEAREYRPAWHDGSGLTARGRAVIDTLRRAEEHGLRADDYVPASPRDSGSPWEAAALADIALSLSTMRYVKDLHEGRLSPSELGLRLEVTHHHPNLSDELLDLTRSTAIRDDLDSFAPPYPEYGRLKSALARYRALDELEGWQPLYDGTKLEPGDTYRDIDRLRRRLRQTGDLARNADSAGSHYDPVLVEAMKRFQARHSINDDGVIGERTYRALNTPWSARRSQIIASMERWRWVSEHLDGTPILVNIPEFKLRGIETRDGRRRTAFESRVIVGRHYRQFRTPIFSGIVRYIDFRPFWNVPVSIIRNEMWDRLAEPGFLQKHGYEIVRDTSLEAEPLPASPSNLAKVRSGALRLRQRPGLGNALGSVKLVFPNQYSVFLHGTPERYLFQREERAFSHGCIRVEKAVELAAWVLEGQEGWDEEVLAEALSRETTTRIPVDREIPVYILYLTAYVEGGLGEIHFGHDIYGLDVDLLEALGYERPLTSVGRAPYPRE